MFDDYFFMRLLCNMAKIPKAGRAIPVSRPIRLASGVINPATPA